MKTLFYDIMIDGQYDSTMRYKYSPLFMLDVDDVICKTIEKRPSLKNKVFTIACDLFSTVVNLPEKRQAQRQAQRKGR